MINSYIQVFYDFITYQGFLEIYSFYMINDQKLPHINQMDPMKYL
jgi:hypothetical protein